MAPSYPASNAPVVDWREQMNQAPGGGLFAADALVSGAIDDK